MTEMEDDVRRMLRQKAAEIQVSDDAWEQITARIQRRPARTLGRRLALAGAAAAAVAGTVVVANLPGSSNVATAPPTTETRAVPNGDYVELATAWLRERVPRANLPAGELMYDDGEGNAAVAFHGTVETEVVLRQGSGRPGWFVVGAASDMIPLFDVTYDRQSVNGRATVEAAGTLTVTYLADDTREIGVTGPREVRAGEGIELGMGSEQPGTSATVRAVLVVDGVSHLSEVTVGRTIEPPAPTGSYVSIWPATDSVGLAGLQRQADAGEQTYLLDPQELAGRFLTDQGVDGFSTRAFQQGDNSSGEVPYGIEGGASGTVLLRRTGGKGSVWYVTGVTSDDLRIEAVHREETDLVADVWSDVDGTLNWTGAPPVEARSGRTVSIAKPDVPLGSHPVVVRLTDGDRTLAIAARLG